MTRTLPRQQIVFANKVIRTHMAAIAKHDGRLLFGHPPKALRILFPQPFLNEFLSLGCTPCAPVGSSQSSFASPGVLFIAVLSSGIVLTDEIAFITMSSSLETNQRKVS